MAGFGETLRQARAHKGVSLKEAEQATRITRHYLAALEEEDFSALPPVIYQRGFVRNYSIYLDLDPSKTLTLFEEVQGIGVRPVYKGVTAVPPIDMPSHWAPNFAIIAFSVVLSAIVFAWVYTAYVAPPTDERVATPPMATVTPVDIALPTQAQSTKVPEPTATTEPETEPTAAATEEATESTNPSGGDNQLGEAPAEDDNQVTAPENADQPDEAAEEDSESAEGDAAAENDQISAEPTEYVTVGEFDTMIEITAEEDIYITFVADGNVVFDGDLSNGDSTGAFPGSEFEVYTSSGGATLFTNGCGEEFYFGDDMSEANYEFGAGPTSCAVDPAQLSG